MNSAFDIIFNGMGAFQQAMMLLGGGICFAIGAAILGNGLYWRLKAERVDGTIIGIRKKDIYYHPVYRYTLSNGETRESTSSTGIGSSRGMDTGRVLRLMVFPDKPDEVRPAGSVVYLVAGLFFLGPGLLFLKLALSTYPINWLTFAMIGLLVLMGFMKFKKHIIPKDKRGAIDEWKAMRKAARAQEWEKYPVIPLEEFRDTPEGLKAAAVERKQAKAAAPILFILGAAMCFGGYYFGQKMIDLEQHGLRAPGKVVQLDVSYDSDGDASYHPVVAFTDDKGRAQQFRDSFGSNPASYRTGEEVKVLYLAARPATSATIDRGWMNWLLPGILGGVGGIFLLLGFSTLLKYRDQSA